MVAFDFAQSSSRSSQCTPTARGAHTPTNIPANTLPQRSHEEDIYEDLCYVTLRVGRERESCSVLTLEPREKRDYCIKELVETERNYSDALNMIINHFMTPLSKLLDKHDAHTVIFLNIKALSEIHGKFYDELYKCYSHVGEQSEANTANANRISSCFLTFKDKFVIYGDYCANLPKAQQIIDDLCARVEAINAAVIKCQMRANNGKFKLRDLLSLPMQRILKYHLLLSELIKSTCETHDDYSGLQRAHEAMVDIGQYINEVKRDCETLEIIADIQSSIIDLEMPRNTELKDYGRLLKDGELKIRAHDETRIKTRYVFVFDKVMLMCKSIRGEQYSYKEALILDDYQVEDMPNQSTIQKLTKQWSNGWLLVHRQNKSSYTLYAKTDDMKRKWMDAIERALDNVCPLACREGSTDHTFAMYTFSTATVCADCDKLLRGTFFQGYRCTVCYISVHKQCIATVRSCGAPSLPPRPPLPPSSPGVSLNSFSGDEDNNRNSVQDLRRLNSVANSEGSHSNHNSIIIKLIHARALSDFEGDSTAGQLSFASDDVLAITNKCVQSEGQQVWWEGKNIRTSEEGIFPAAVVVEVDSSNASEGAKISYEDPTGMSTLYQPQNNGDNVSANLEEYAWFAGVMERQSAQSALDGSPNGTFLVRISAKQKGSFVISLNYSGQVKHMRVYVTNDHHYYYLSETRYFKTIVDLIEWYELNSLCESFNLVNTNLSLPFKRDMNAVNSLNQLCSNASTQSIGCSPLCPTRESSPPPPTLCEANACPLSPIAYAIAMYSFTGSSSNLLSLRKGDRIAILSKAGEGKGWWKGQINERIGYFPLAYVTQMKECID